MISQKKKILIVGAKFGEVYLNAFLEDHPWIAPVGLVARGSPRARRLAHAHAVPQYTSVEDVPGPIDGACVVVRSAIVGGDGTRLAETLLARGVSVLQEHPVHPDDVQRLQDAAQGNGLSYRVNPFYRHARAPRTFIRAAREVQAQTGQAPVFARFMTSRQLLYSMLDLICLALAWNPATVSVRLSGKVGPFQGLLLEAADRRADLLLQTTMDRDDPDQHSLVMHSGQLLWPSGTLTHVATFGPVVWSPTLYMTGHLDDRMCLYQDAARIGLNAPTGRVLADAAACWSDAFERDGAEGVRCALEEWLHPGTTGDGTARAATSDPAYDLALSRLWHHVMHCAGPIAYEDHEPPVRVDCGRLGRAVTETAA
ncbi:Gfo/Idh/MocA family oxidoreductase [Roseospira visakhapatnamensis]|uniref:Thiazolinyl reductase component of yersiniabactin synthetase n=1 Tax=Roseospira visakhapatnamensis TaxID=390880 RepID=A0A7W6WAF1_9PROT|nr:Gfo/Idh/MocA family oxidoreductase [Roseospira visakhapatnamensis]MBB4267125.1 thiazolinyl reductase component of yersiniabactin synthetase [Roseospira visakhapatnamensis]